MQNQKINYKRLGFSLARNPFIHIMWAGICTFLFINFTFIESNLFYAFLTNDLPPVLNALMTVITGAFVFCGFLIMTQTIAGISYAKKIEKHYGPKTLRYIDRRLAEDILSYSNLEVDKFAKSVREYNSSTSLNI